MLPHLPFMPCSTSPAPSNPTNRREDSAACLYPSRTSTKPVSGRSPPTHNSHQQLPRCIPWRKPKHAAVPRQVGGGSWSKPSTPLFLAPKIHQNVKGYKWGFKCIVTCRSTNLGSFWGRIKTKLVHFWEAMCCLGANRSRKTWGWAGSKPGALVHLDLPGMGQPTGFS